MTELAEVFLWGGRIGFVSLSDNSSALEFEYDKSFVGAGVEPSPIAMPVNGRSYSFPELREETFHSLPGMLADSLLGKFGSAVLDAWLMSHGRTLDMLSPIERLCYLGSRGMGALEYRPAKGITSDLTYSYNPGSRWTSGHQMSIAGKNTGIGIYDLMAVSKDVGLKESRARQIIQDVITAVERWSEFAGIAGVDERKMKLIEAKIKQNDY